MAASSEKLGNRRPLNVEDVIAILRRKGVLNKRHAQQVGAAIKPDDGRHPIVALGAQNIRSDTSPPYPLSVDTITRLVAEAINIPYFKIDPLKIDVESVTGLVSQAYATRFQFLPVKVNDSSVVVATGEPFVSEWVTELAPIIKREIKPVLANPADIARYLKEFYGVSKSIFGATESAAGEQVNIAQDLEQFTELGSIGEPDANDRHIVHLVDWLLQYAFDQRASDIHIEPRREQGNIRFRIDGVLHLVHEMPAPIIAAITSRLKSLGRMDVADKRRPQDGRIKTKSPGGREVELRLSTMPTTFGEKLVARIFDPEKLTQPFEALGFTDNDLVHWRRMIEKPHGVILVTGPTGSGKTTTLYSALKQIARPEINVCTIEDPIEMVEESFNQMQVLPAIDLDFAAGVRTLLRQDPDIIMVGEIRDKETADVAIQAALTGHLVFSTLHTNDATSAIIRLMDIGVPSYLIGATLLGVVAQRLVRTICPHCKTPTPLDRDAWQTLVGDDKMQPPPEIATGAGCDNCRHTGFVGREGIYEILTVTEEFANLIKPSVQISVLRKQALGDGMRPLRRGAADKVAAKKTTIEEVLAIVPPAEFSAADARQ